MDKEEAIEKLEQIKEDVEQGEKFSGKSKFLRKINEKKSFLMKYSCLDNLPDLFVKESLNELSALAKFIKV